MPVIKIYGADTWFSRCVRERSDWACEHCEVKYFEGSSGLECSHFYGRANYAVRHDPLNAFAHCTGCHFKLGGNPYDFTKWAGARLGKDRLLQLTENTNKINRGSFARRDSKKGLRSEISKFYREQFRDMQERRVTGTTGRIELVSYFDKEYG